MSDGAEVLSLFAEPDEQHWVSWTPEGFFDHGPGGETLIGYHLNLVDQGRPKGAAFVAVEQVYKLFFRRDLLVKKFLGGSDAEIAAQLAEIGSVQTVLDSGLPPEIMLSEYCIAANGEETCSRSIPEASCDRSRGRSTRSACSHRRSCCISRCTTAAVEWARWSCAGRAPR